MSQKQASYYVVVRFYDETNLAGPFATLEEARECFEEYDNSAVSDACAIIRGVDVELIPEDDEE